MKTKKAQLAPNMIVGIIIAVAVLIVILVFFTGRFQTGAQQISQLSPQEIDATITACQFSCDSANTATKSSSDCAVWNARYCSRSVKIGDRTGNCEQVSDITKFTCTSDYNCHVTNPCPK